MPMQGAQRRSSASSSRQQQREQQQLSNEGVQTLRERYLGQWVDGVVDNIASFGAFVRIPAANNVAGLLHISDLSPNRVDSVSSVVEEGQELQVLVRNVRDDNKVQLALFEKPNAPAQSDVIDEDEVKVGSPVTNAFEYALKQAGVDPSQFKNVAAKENISSASAAASVSDGSPSADGNSTGAPASAQGVESAAGGSASTVSNDNGHVTPQMVKELREASGAGMMDCKEALTETSGDMDEAMSYLRKKGLSKAEKKKDKVAAEGAIGAYVHTGNSIGVLVEVNCETDFVGKSDKFKQLVHDVAMQVASSDEVAYVSVDDIPDSVLQEEKEREMQRDDLADKPDNVKEQIVSGRLEKTKKSMTLLSQPFIKDTNKTVEEVVKEATFELGEKVSLRRFERYALGEEVESEAGEQSDDFATEVSKQVQEAQQQAAQQQSSEQAAEDTSHASDEPSVKVSPKLVKELREKTGAGMMECKKALAEAGGEDMDAARDILKSKGMAKADKKSGRRAADGAIGAYVHTGNSIGVLVEVNCETDFVGRSDDFQQLVHDMAMQIAASESVTRVDSSHIKQAERERVEQEEWQREDLEGKPDDVKQKIVSGRVDKRLQDGTLMEMEFIKDPSKTVAEHVKEKVAALGENIVVRRFTRYDLGAGIETPDKPSFAEEVQQQAAGNF